MPHTDGLSEQVATFIEQLHELRLGAEPPSEQLLAIAENLCRLAASPTWQRCSYREAAPREELLYKLAVSPRNGPSLYLVSDGATVVSPPHDHKTWAVIAGIRGKEVNRRYTMHPVESGVVVQSSVVEVGPGEVLVLSEAEIHSTEVNNGAATFHLHLYGRPLHELPSFRFRCYRIAQDS